MDKTRRQARKRDSARTLLCELLEKRALLTVPAITNFSFSYETTHSLTLDVTPSMVSGAPGVTDALTKSDLTLERLGTDTNVSQNNIELTYSGANPATFRFTGIPDSLRPDGSILTDGNYRASISKQELVHAGDPMNADAVHDFWVLAADLTGGRTARGIAK
jgi:hypothetical protein